jgi:hypothetical protein
MVNMRLAHQLTLVVIVGIGFMLFLSACQSAPTPVAAPIATSAAVAPTIQPSPVPQVAPTVLPPPDVAELQIAIAKQQIQIEALSTKVALQEERLQDAKAKVTDELDRRLFWIVVVTTLAVAGVGFYGIKTKKDIDDKVQQRIQDTASKAESQFRSILDKWLSFDPSRFPIIDPERFQIRIREGHPTVDMLAERQRLIASGFKHLLGYTRLGDECRTGITIVPITSNEEETEFVDFIHSMSFDSSRAAFILYVPSMYRIRPETMKSYGNLAVANMAITLVNAVIAIVRGLEPDKPPEPASTPKPTS